jgi:hypothetical protein
LRPVSGEGAGDAFAAAGLALTPLLTLTDFKALSAETRQGAICAGGNVECR